MAKTKKAKRSTTKATKRTVSRKSAMVEYNSPTFLLFLVFVLVVSVLLVSRMMGAY